MRENKFVTYLGAFILVGFFLWLWGADGIFPDAPQAQQATTQQTAPQAPEAAPAVTEEQPATSEPTSPATSPETQTAPIYSGEIPRTVEGSIKLAKTKEMLNSLTVSTPSTQTYNRDYFKHWVDSNGDGCTARAEVLKIESLKPTTVKAGTTCTIETGEWFSVYDNKTITTASTVDIDHFVPLNEAWKSGAYSWDAKKREIYANDLEYAPSLIAVTATSNRSKSDQDPTTWMPPEGSYRCTYTATWITVKWRWQLTIDTAEKAALENALNACTDDKINLATK